MLLRPTRELRLPQLVPPMRILHPARLKTPYTGERRSMHATSALRTAYRGVERHGTVREWALRRVNRELGEQSARRAPVPLQAQKLMHEADALVSRPRSIVAHKPRDNDARRMQAMIETADRLVAGISHLNEKRKPTPGRVATAADGRGRLREALRLYKLASMTSGGKMPVLKNKLSAVERMLEDKPDAPKKVAEELQTEDAVGWGFRGLEEPQVEQERRQVKREQDHSTEQHSGQQQDSWRRDYEQSQPGSRRLGPAEQVGGEPSFGQRAYSGQQQRTEYSSSEVQTAPPAKRPNPPEHQPTTLSTQQLGIQYKDAQVGIQYKTRSLPPMSPLPPSPVQRAQLPLMQAFPDPAPVPSVNPASAITLTRTPDVRSRTHVENTPNAKDLPLSSDRSVNTPRPTTSLPRTELPVDWHGHREAVAQSAAPNAAPNSSPPPLSFPSPSAAPDASSSGRPANAPRRTLSLELASRTPTVELPSRSWASGDRSQPYRAAVPAYAGAPPVLEALPLPALSWAALKDKVGTAAKGDPMRRNEVNSTHTPPEPAPLSAEKVHDELRYAQRRPAPAHIPFTTSSTRALEPRLASGSVEADFTPSRSHFSTPPALDPDPVRAPLEKNSFTAQARAYASRAYNDAPDAPRMYPNANGTYTGNRPSSIRAPSSQAFDPYASSGAHSYASSANAHPTPSSMSGSPQPVDVEHASVSSSTRTKSLYAFNTLAAGASDGYAPDFHTLPRRDVPPRSHTPPPSTSHPPNSYPSNTSQPSFSYSRPYPPHPPDSSDAYASNELRAPRSHPQPAQGRPPPAARTGKPLKFFSYSDRHRRLLRAYFPWAPELQAPLPRRK
ncbi:hypothetical protein C8R43DRAFT_155045 [Mycena crocata]|nr:hypothetical protein C8R43DRAFT_155045 [Mycena crocata]